MKETVNAMKSIQSIAYIPVHCTISSFFRHSKLCSTNDTAKFEVELAWVMMSWKIKEKGRVEETLWKV